MLKSGGGQTVTTGRKMSIIVDASKHYHFSTMRALLSEGVCLWCRQPLDIQTEDGWVACSRNDHYTVQYKLLNNIIGSRPAEPGFYHDHPVLWLEDGR